MEELWVVCVYIAENGAELLVRMWYKRSKNNLVELMSFVDSMSFSAFQTA